MIPTLLKAAAAAVGVIIAMFFFTYLPQVAVLAFVTGPLGASVFRKILVEAFAHTAYSSAFIGAIPLVLGESYLVLTFLTRTFLIGQAGVDLFDAVSLLSPSSRPFLPLNACHTGPPCSKSHRTREEGTTAQPGFKGKRRKGYPIGTSHYQAVVEQALNRWHHSIRPHFAP
jgi:hypothetical protein